MTAFLLALGLVLYPSTQLRISGLPLGPGEMLLIIWLGIATLRQTLLPSISVNLALSRVVTFWVVLLLALCAGMIVGLAREPFHYYTGILHDLFAYTLIFALACMFSLDLGGPARRRTVIWRVVAFGAVSMFLQIASGYGLFPMPGVDPWFYDRLSGWSLDPNQLGFFAMFLMFLAAHLAETADTPREALAALVCAVPAAVAGVLSKSDTFLVALMAAGSVFLVLKSTTWLQNYEMAPTVRGTIVAIGLLSLPLAAASVAPFWAAALERIEQRSEEVYAQGGQGELRFHLWQEAYEKGLESGMIGYGPGPHLTSKSWKRPPPYKFEAHNTSLDLFTQGGIVAMAAFVWLCVSTLREGWRSRLPALSAMIMGVAVFSMFHFVVRHPNFWFAIVLCLLEADRVRPPFRSIRSEVAS
ncbi:O-antigen ligase family protein [Defluviimonas sp. D31]|uniref:O-antigen ligase family protein n=1 Tax=Defluviimonas sp. D31 TaxID=3083253 RepID=UPI00296EB5FF|nr:O-antigen ligase family protein [Defluviimonas sp. D31]MDW4549731.1 O-antigen ligase family protein [Defluviimonas sp. D31]